MGFTPFWDFKLTNAIHAVIPGVYTSDKISNLNRIKKIKLKTDVIDGRIVNGSRQPILYSFVLDKPSGYKLFSNPQTNRVKKINKPVLKTITFYLEDDSPNEFEINGETLNFTLKLIKI